jgi:hypothetical protein
MADWKADRDALVNETMALAKGIRHERPLPREMVERVGLKPMDWGGPRARGNQLACRELQGASAALHEGTGRLRRVRVEGDAGIAAIARSQFVQEACTTPAALWASASWPIAGRQSQH